MTVHDSEDLQSWQEELVAALRRDAGETEPAERPVASGSEQLEVLAFDLNDEVYAVDIRDVAEILLPRKPTPVPRTPPFVVGVLTLRGLAVPVIDLAMRLGLPSFAPSRKSRIVVLRDGDERMGCWVSGVRGVIRFTSGEIEATGFASVVDPGFLKGIGYDQKGSLVGVLLGEHLCDFTLAGVAPGERLADDSADPGAEMRASNDEGIELRTAEALG